MLTRGTKGRTHGGFAVFLWLLPAQNNHQAGDEGGVLPFVGALLKMHLKSSVFRGRSRKAGAEAFLDTSLGPENSVLASFPSLAAPREPLVRC